MHYLGHEVSDVDLPLIRPIEHHRDLAEDPLTRVLEDLGELTAEHLLVRLGQLPAHGRPTRGPENVDGHLQRLD